jgi:hypothetical protein
MTLKGFRNLIYNINAPKLTAIFIQNNLIEEEDILELSKMMLGFYG